jgi:hypothetical protein
MKSSHGKCMKMEKKELRKWGRNRKETREKGGQWTETKKRELRISRKKSLRKGRTINRRRRWIRYTENKGQEEHEKEEGERTATVRREKLCHAELEPEVKSEVPCLLLQQEGRDGRQWRDLMNISTPFRALAFPPAGLAENRHQPTMGVAGLRSMIAHPDIYLNVILISVSASSDKYLYKNCVSVASQR